MAVLGEAYDPEQRPSEAGALADTKEGPNLIGLRRTLRNFDSGDFPRVSRLAEGGRLVTGCTGAQPRLKLP